MSPQESPEERERRIAELTARVREIRSMLPHHGTNVHMEYELDELEHEIWELKQQRSLN